MDFSNNLDNTLQLEIGEQLVHGQHNNVRAMPSAALNVRST